MIKQFILGLIQSAFKVLQKKAITEIRIAPKKYDVKYGREITKAQQDAITKYAVLNILGPMKARFIKENFEQGGKPRFRSNTLSTIYTKSFRGLGYSPMMGKGDFKRSVIDNPKIVYIPGSLEPQLEPKGMSIKTRSSLNILKHGGTIIIPRTRKMRFLFLRFSEEAGSDTTVGKIFRYAAFSKKPTLKIKIPSRDWTQLTILQKIRMERAKLQIYEEAISKYTVLGKWSAVVDHFRRIR